MLAALHGMARLVTLAPESTLCIYRNRVLNLTCPLHPFSKWVLQEGTWSFLEDRAGRKIGFGQPRWLRVCVVRSARVTWLPTHLPLCHARAPPLRLAGTHNAASWTFQLSQLTRRVRVCNDE